MHRVDSHPRDVVCRRCMETLRVHGGGERRVSVRECVSVSTDEPGAPPGGLEASAARDRPALPGVSTRRHSSIDPPRCSFWGSLGFFSCPSRKVKLSFPIDISTGNDRIQHTNP